MAAGFITKALAALAATTARWVEYADGSQSPVHGAVLISPTTGLPLNTTDPAPVSVDALPLPSGAATVAKQPGFGTAGTPAADVITVQGNTAGTPIPVANRGIYSAAGRAITDGAEAQAAIDSRGNLRVALVLGNSDTIVQANTASDTLSNIGVGLKSLGLAHGWVESASAWMRQRMTSGGAAITKPYAAESNDWQYPGISGGVTDVADVTVKSAAGAGVRNYMTAMQFCNRSAVPSEIVVKDGATVIWRGLAPANMTVQSNITFPTPLRSSGNVALNVAMATTGTQTIISAQGYSST